MSQACVCMFLWTTQRRRLPELQQNKESVGELWLGLLRFYTEEFDFKEHVISIRQRKRLTTFEKQWTSKCIAIEGAPRNTSCSYQLMATGVQTMKVLLYQTAGFRK